MHHLEPGVSQIGVPVQMLPRPIRIGVLKRAVRLSDRAVFTPEEVHSCDRPVLAPDPDLKLGRWQAAFVEGHPRDRLERRLGQIGAEADDTPGPVHAWPVSARGNNASQLGLGRPASVQGRVGNDHTRTERRHPGQIYDRPRHRRDRYTGEDGDVTGWQRQPADPDRLWPAKYPVVSRWATDRDRCPVLFIQ